MNIPIVFGILIELLNSKQVKSSYLAEKFKVSTIQAVKGKSGASTITMEVNILGYYVMGNVTALVLCKTMLRV